MTTKDATRIRETKSRTAMAKVAFGKKKGSFTSKWYENVK
jgi:hypothetical protein